MLTPKPNRFDTLDANGNTSLSLHLKDESPAMVEKLLAYGAQLVATMTTLAWRAMEETHRGARPPVMQIIRTHDARAETLRQAADEAIREVAAQKQANEQVRPKMRARL